MGIFEFDQEQYEQALRRDSYEEGEARGEARKLISLICKKMQREKTLETIAEELEEEIAAIEPIYRTVKEIGCYDCGKIYEKLAEAGSF